MQEIAHLQNREWVEGIENSWKKRYAYVKESTERLQHFYQGILNLHPDHSQANLAVGRILLEKGSEEGILHLEKTFGSDPEIVLSACGMAYHYYFDRGDEAEAEKYLAKAVETSESIQESE